MTSPLLRRLSNKHRPFRVVILGQNGVGKSALTVRYLTRRFIGDYDPLLENTYSCTRCIDGETVSLEVRDTAAVEEHSKLEVNIKWADAFILVYAVTDRCSFDECSRLRVLINSYSKHVKTAGPGPAPPIPAVLVGNQVDKAPDRMVGTAEGRDKAHEMNCAGFYEVSVREDWESAEPIFTDIYRQWRRRHQRSSVRISRSYSMNKAADLAAELERQTGSLHRRRKALYTVS